METKRRVLLMIVFFLAFSRPVFAGNPPLTCQEVDGSPKGSCSKLLFPNGSLTKSGSSFTYADLFNGDAGAAYEPTTDVLTVGGSSIGGSGEYVQGAHAGIDFDDGGTGVMRFYGRAGTNNEKLDLDLESSANKAKWTTPSGVTEESHPWDFVANRYISGGGVTASFDVSSSTTSFYKMEDNAANGTMVDAQGATHNGTCSSNTSTMTTTGKLNNGLHFNEASTQKCDLGSTTDFKFAGDFAVAFWMKHTLSTTSKRVLGNRLASGTNTGMEVTHVGSTLKTQFTVDLGASNVQLNSTTTTNTGSWFFVVAQRNGGSCELYINGTLEAGPSSCSGTLAGAGNFYIGSTPLAAATGGYYTGDLDNVMILKDRALTSTEITFLYNSGTGTDSLSGGVTPIKVIAADDTTPDVSSGEIFVTSANTGATAITDLDNPAVGQIVRLVGGSSTNASTIADSGNFHLSGAMTLNQDDSITLLVRADNDYVELSRSDN